MICSDLPFEHIHGAHLHRGDNSEAFALPPGAAVITDPPYGTGHYSTDTEPHLERFFAMLPTSTFAVFGYPEKLIEWSMQLERCPDEWVTWWPSNAALKTAQRKANISRESECIAIWGESLRQVKQERTSEGAKLAHTNGHSVDKSYAVVGDVWTFPSPGLGFNSRLRNHPNEKPVELMERLVLLLTNEGDVVVDPFMGSGTTGVACANLGRLFVGFEIDGNYFDVACDRIRAAYAQQRLFG